MKNSPTPKPSVSQDDEAEMRRIEAMLRAVDPGREAAAALSARSRERVLWSCRHPILAWCMLHHTLIATVAAGVLLMVLYAWLTTKSREVRENNTLPEAVSPPVQILVPPTDSTITLP